MNAARDFAAELLAARHAGDWEAHARIWDERIGASVDADEAGIRLTDAAPQMLKALEDICADTEMVRTGGPLIDQARRAILAARGAQ